jgi:TatD DNase family protein
VRGKRNEPAFVVHTAAMLAELQGITAAELGQVTTENFFRLFSRATPVPVN